MSDHKYPDDEQLLSVMLTVYGQDAVNNFSTDLKRAAAAVVRSYRGSWKVEMRKVIDQMYSL